MDHPQESDEPEADQLDPLALVVGAAEHIADQTRRHPYRTLGVALGVGYVLGGGLPRFAVRMAGMAVLRSVGQAILTSDALAELARSALADDSAEQHEPTRRPETPRDRGGRFTS